ncbi:hypothetical protein NKH17_18090 [Mesorhizobium sp. M1334]|uniref:hypothetical protein n=1 Tax=Mesorhizobium sp. M1334 TaxID=2957084 RepID=UPI0033356B8C
MASTELLVSNPTLPERGSLSTTRHGISLLHCLPDSFHGIRHYGFIANGCRRTRCAIIRLLLVAMKPAPTAASGETTRPLPRFDPTVCPCCGGILRITATLPRRTPGRHDRSRIPHDDRMSPQHRSWQRRGISVDGRNNPHIVIFPTSPKSRRITPQHAQDADGRVYHLGQRRRLGLVFTDMAALHHTKPLTWNGLRDTNPTARGRVSGFAQSGFNEVAHRPKPDHHRRATLQIPPDSRRGDFVIQDAGWAEASIGCQDPIQTIFVSALLRRLRLAGHAGKRLHCSG